MDIDRRRLLLLPALSSFPCISSASGSLQLVHLLPRSSPLTKDAGSLRQGLMAALGKTQGIRNVPVRLLDEPTDSDGLIQQLKEACQKAPTVLLAPLGPIAVSSVLKSDLLASQDLLVVNPIPGADAFRGAHPRVFHVRASDTDQLLKIIQHAQTIGISRMALVTEADGSPAAESLWKTASQATSRLGNITISHITATTPAEVKEKIRHLKNSPQAAISAGSPVFMALTSDTLRKLTPGIHTYALSYLTAEVAREVLGSRSRGIAISQVFPSLTKDHLPLIKEFLMTMRQHRTESAALNAYHLEGYVVGMLIRLAIGRAKVLSINGLETALRAAGRIDFGGYEVDFSKTSEGNHFVEMGVIDSSGAIRS